MAENTQLTIRKLDLAWEIARKSITDLNNRSQNVEQDDTLTLLKEAYDFISDMVENNTQDSTSE